MSSAAALAPHAWTGAAKLPDVLYQQLDHKHLPSLDGMRAVAAFMVVLYHGGLLWCQGGQGVLAFFVLSGFLITWLLLKEEERTGRISIKLFYIRRSLRIFPAFYCFFALELLKRLIMHKAIHVPQAVAAFFYVNNYYQAFYGDPNMQFSHSWSLGVEEQFYLLWPLTFLVLRRNRNRAVFLGVTIAAVWIYRAIAVYVLNWSTLHVYEAFDTRMDHLLIGCLLAVVLREGMFAAFWSWLCSRRYLAFFSLALIVLSTGAAQVFVVSRYRDVLGFIIDPVLIAVFLTQCIAAPSYGFARVLNLRWVRYLGEISYPIYLYHPLAGSVKTRLADCPAPSWVTYLAAIVIMASASYWLVEKPFLRLKARFASE